MNDMESEKDILTLTDADATAVDEVLDGQQAVPVSPERKARVEAWLGVVGGSRMPERAGDLVTRTLAAVQAERMKAETARQGAAVGAASAEVAAQRARSGWQWRRRAAEIGAMAIAATLLLLVTIEGVGTAR